MIEPKLRFKADDGSQFPDWEEKTFNDVADYKKGPFGSALKKEIFVPKSNDTVKVYEQQNAISKDWKLERYFVTNEYFQLKMKSFAVSGGDIIVSCAGTIGEMYELPDDAEEGIINQALMRVRIKKSVINSIIFRCVFDKMISTEGVKISNGSALKNIPPFADMKKQSVFVPSLPEQQKIAEFLSTIDTVIAKQKETVSAWEERKKGVMQKLFNQEVRFKADDGSDFPEWEEKKLSEIASIHARIGWQNLRKDEFLTDGNYLLITGTDFCNGRVNCSTCYYVDRERYEQDKNIQVENGTILVTKDGTLGKVALVENLNMPATLNAGVFAIKVIHADTISKFLYHWLVAPMLLEYASKKSTGGTIKHLNQGILVDFPVGVPCLAEQQKIADCLSSLDEVIEKQKATLAAWEELKKGLLQQMFV